MGTGIIKSIVFDIALDALYTPIWWYTEGLVEVFRFFGRNVRYGANIIGIGVWAKNLFRPMYGERSWQGRIVSFVMRFIVLVWDCLMFVVLLSILLLIVLLWLMMPILLVWQLTRIVV